MKSKVYLLIVASLLIVIFFPVGLWAQDNSLVVSGSVSNASQEPLVGVSVLVKETHAGTMTDADGRFSIKAAEGQKLEFHYIGYETKVVKVTGKTMLVVLSENQVELDDVVVIGWPKTRKH